MQLSYVLFTVTAETLNHPPCPIVCALSTDGSLILYQAINRLPNADHSLVKPPTTVSLKTNIIAASGASQQPSVASAFGQAPVFGTKPTLGNSSGTGLFGAKPDSSAASGGGLFAAASSGASTGTGLFGGKAGAAPSGGRLFGGKAGAASSGGALFGAKTDSTSGTSSAFGGGTMFGTSSVFGGTAAKQTVDSSAGFKGFPSQSSMGGAAMTTFGALAAASQPAAEQVIV